MARIDVDKAVVLERVVAQLRSALNLNDRQVYETLSPDFLPKIPGGGEFFIAVSPLPGDFIDGEQIENNITEEWGVAVTAYTRVFLDSTDRDEKMLRDTNRGLFAIKKKILRALVGQDLQTDEGDTFLRQLLYARTCRQPDAAETPERKIPIGRITLEFGVDFDWELTEG
jgi:hypothetical protein